MRSIAHFQQGGFAFPSTPGYQKNQGISRENRIGKGSLTAEFPVQIDQDPLFQSGVPSKRDPAIRLRFPHDRLEVALQRAIFLKSRISSGVSVPLRNVFHLLKDFHPDEIPFGSGGHRHECPPTNRLERTFQPIFQPGRILVPRFQQACPDFGTRLDDSIQPIFPGDLEIIVQ